MRIGIVMAASLALVLGCGSKENTKPAEGQAPKSEAKPLNVHKVNSGNPEAKGDKAQGVGQEAKSAEAAKADEASKVGETKPAEAKAAENKPAEVKPEEAKPAEGKPEEAKPGADAAKASGEAAKPAEEKAEPEVKPAVDPAKAEGAQAQPAAGEGKGEEAKSDVAADKPAVDPAKAGAEVKPVEAPKPVVAAAANPVVASAAAPVGAPAGVPAGIKLPPGASWSPDGEYVPPPFQNVDDLPADQKLREAMIKRLKPSPRHNDPRVLRGMAAVPRHMYMLAKDRKEGYAQNWFRIGHGQTITDPATVARMTAILAIKPTDKVLEIGTGSGYQGSVLAQLTPNVFTIEIVEPLAKRTHALLEKLGYKDAIKTKIADGYYGWEENAPFDKIIVTCAADHIPIPLLQQLKPGGLMVIPVGPRFQPGKLYFIAKDEKGQVHKKVLINVKFVPMTKLTDWGKEDPRAEERRKMDREGRKQLGTQD